MKNAFNILFRLALREDAMMISVTLEFKLIALGVVLVIIGFLLASVIGVEIGVYTLWLGVFLTGLGIAVLLYLRIKRLIKKA